MASTIGQSSCRTRFRLVCVSRAKLGTLLVSLISAVRAIAVARLCLVEYGRLSQGSELLLSRP